MSDLIVINGYTPPAPSKYDVTFRKIYGADEQLENGYDYIEQTRSQAPTIALAWTNISEADAQAIISNVSQAEFTCSYWYGSIVSDSFSCDDQKLTLKYFTESERYYDLSLTLKS